MKVIFTIKGVIILKMKLRVNIVELIILVGMVLFIVIPFFWNWTW